MSTSNVTNQPVKSSLHWSALIQLVLSALAEFLLLGAAVIIALTSLFQFFSQGTGNTDPTQSLMVATSLAFIGVLVLPSAWFSWKHISHKDIEPTYRSERPEFGLVLTILTIVLVGGAILLGNWVSQNNRIAWFLLPPLNIIATGLPALWLVYVGTRGLLPRSPKRQWGVFASGLVLGPLVTLILELILLIIMGILAILWVMRDPSLADQLNGLVFRLQNAGQDINAIFNLLMPFLLNPGVLFIGFVFISFLVPVIEESLKPIGVWFLAGQKITPAQGFGYGVISGAGFALFENLGNTSAGSEIWAILAASRISALLLHCFTAGLVGWALASAWSQRRYLRLGITYVIAILIHGLWNGMSILSAASSFQGLTSIPISTSIQQIGAISTDGIVVLGILVLGLYIGFNAVLRRTSPENPPPCNGQTPIFLENRSQPSIDNESSDPLSEINLPSRLAGDHPQSSSPDPLSLGSSDNPLNTPEINP